MPPCHGGDRGFKSRPDRHYRRCSSMVERNLAMVDTRVRFPSPAPLRYQWPWSNQGHFLYFPRPVSQSPITKVSGPLSLFQIHGKVSGFDCHPPCFWLQTLSWSFPRTPPRSTSPLFWLSRPKPFARENRSHCRKYLNVQFTSLNHHTKKAAVAWRSFLLYEL